MKNTNQDKGRIGKAKAGLESEQTKSLSAVPGKREVAKQLNCHYLFGGWGIKFLPRWPDGRIHKLFSIVPLDGWLFGDDMLHEMRERDFEL